MRLNRYLALCGFGSRRNVETLVSERRVRINGETIDSFSRLVLDDDMVEVDGHWAAPQDTIYLVINKPKGYVCAVRDSRTRTVIDLLPARYRRYRVFPVGRLDRDSEGLLILTNDGDFAQRTIHPGVGLEKEYEVLLDRPVDRRSLLTWREGVASEGEFLKPLGVVVLDRLPKGRWVSVTLSEGKKREIRRMACICGFSVQSLLRRRIGKMELGSLASGSIVEMSVHRLETMIREGGAVVASAEGEEDTWTASMNVQENSSRPVSWGKSKK
jgi:23S rRNA pseudouridine2605 synthase